MKSEWLRTTEVKGVRFFFFKFVSLKIVSNFRKSTLMYEVKGSLS